MKKTLRILFGASIILLALAVTIVSSSFPGAVVAGRKIPGPAFFPVLLSIILVPSGLYQIAAGIKTQAGEGGWSFGLGAANGVIIVTALVAYVLLMDVLGYALSTVMFSMVLLLRLKVPFLKAAVISLVIAGFIVAVFGRVFLIQLPAGQLGLPW
ncbi:MAG: tripartite tricarboxylate transporter TctB family protein [Aminivibrio sp.]|jgi:hypothetical protein